MLSLLLSVQTTLSVSVSDSVTDTRDSSSVINQSVKTIKTIYVGVSKTWIEVEGLTGPIIS